MDVYYDPRNLEHSVLIPGNSAWDVFVRLALSLGLLALVIFECSCIDGRADLTERIARMDGVEDQLIKFVDRAGLDHRPSIGIRACAATASYAGEVGRV